MLVLCFIKPNTKKNKLLSLFQPYPYHVTERNDSMSTAKQIFDCHTITSNYACFELLPEAAAAPKLLTELSPLNLEETLTAKKCCHI